jgi:tetratricopeptide (TPR) repeat protein
MAIEIGERLKDNNQLPLYYGNMGETLINNGKLKEAIAYSQKALAIAVQQEQLQHISTSNIRLGLTLL